MRNPKIFLFIVGIISILLFLLDLPNGVHVAKKTFNFSDINTDLGPIQIKKKLDYKLGLDLQGGTKLTYNVDMSKIGSAERTDAFQSARNIIEKRINFFGVSEPTIQTLKLGDEYRIIVELPGLSDIDQALDVIGRTAQLTFWEESTTPSASESALPIGMNQIFASGAAQTKLTGKDLKSAKVVFDQRTGTPQVQLNFTSEGTQLFGTITKNNVGKPVVIALDNQVIEAPRVNEPILTGSAVISGSFTPDLAKNLAIQLNAGALPAPLHIIAQTSVGPSLGIDSLKKSLFAGLIGFISVMLFMIYLYRKEGALASIALLVYTIITLFVFKLIPVTLTLAGIAGFILSIGMAVDANILIFERMREELRAGKSKDVAVRLGFSRAWTSIRDSNISSLITSVILYYFGSGIVRGFAITLAIGILISMFSAITVTRNLLMVFDSKTKVKK